MRVEFLSIGNELLDGRVADTNLLRLAQHLAQVNLHIVYRQSVLDECQAIITALDATVARQTQLCVVCGGLGPTADDLTAEAFADWLGKPLQRSKHVAQQLRHHYAKRHIELTPNQLRQAERPEGSELIDNPLGMAPGFTCEQQGCWFVVLPGVPREFDGMVTSYLLPKLVKQGHRPLLRQSLGVFGLLEAEIDHRLQHFQHQFANVYLQYRVNYPWVQLQMHVNREQEAADLQQAFAYVKMALGDFVFSDAPAPSMAKTLLESLYKQQLTLAVAESCTGGLLGHLLTEEPHCSRVFLGGLITYNNQAKINLLGVSQALLEQHGAVSLEVALAMAEQTSKLHGSSIGVGISGIAGPDGGSVEKPVGLVYVGLYQPHKPPVGRKLLLHSERSRNKLMSAYVAMDMVRRAALGLSL